MGRSLEAKEDHIVYGNATSDEVLKEAGVERAEGIISVVTNDADNLFVVLTARELNKNLKIISRASRSGTERKLKKAGANTVVLPDIIGGKKMAKLVTQPDIVEFLDYIILQSHFDVNIEEIKCSQMNAVYINQSIKELIRKNDSGSNLIGVKISKGNYIFNPTDEIKMTPELMLFTLGTPDQIKKLKAIISNG